MVPARMRPIEKIIAPPGSGPAVSDNKQLAMPGSPFVDLRLAFVAVRQHNLPNRQSVAVEDHDAAPPEMATFAFVVDYGPRLAPAR